MRFFSFLLSLTISTAMLGGLFIYIFYKKPQKKVFIHTAIIAIEKSNINRVKKLKKKFKKPRNKKKGSKSSITKRGDIDIKDIFKNVDYNVETEKVKLKENDSVSRLKGIEKELNNLKTSEIKFKLSNKRTGKNSVQNEILLKLQNIWNEISDIVGEYAKIRVNVINKNVEVIILKSNLSLQKQQELIYKIKSVKFKKDFSLLVTFQTKVNK
jgi:hypothetical protein